MNLRNFRSSRRMTRRSSTCRSALLMVLPKRRNNLYISILPGVLSVASVHQRLWMARTLLMAGVVAMGVSAGAGSAGAGSVVASMPSLARALVEPVRGSLAPFTFSKVVPLGSASAALTAASRRSCAVKAPAGEVIVGAKEEAAEMQKAAAHAKLIVVKSLHFTILPNTNQERMH